MSGEPLVLPEGRWEAEIHSEIEPTSLSPLGKHGGGRGEGKTTECMAWPLFWMPFLTLFAVHPFLTPLLLLCSSSCPLLPSDPPQGSMVPRVGHSRQACPPCKRKGPLHLPFPLGPRELLGWEGDACLYAADQNLDCEAGKLDLPLFLFLRAA